LERDFPGGREHQGLRVGARTVDAFDDDGAEGDRLAGAALGLDHEVGAEAPERDGGALHGGWDGEPGEVQTPDDGLLLGGVGRDGEEGC